MLPRLLPDRNDLGHALPDGVVPPARARRRPARHAAADEAVWDLALPHLRHRDNDVHTIYAYGLARALLEAHPEADPDVVLPGIILHDSGWSTVPIPRDHGRAGTGHLVQQRRSFATVRRHEVEGARISREVLVPPRRPRRPVDTICAIIDGHDTRKEATSIEDAILKDADRLWRVTPRGVDTIMDWFGLTREESLAINASRVHGHLFTAEARSMAWALSAVGWVDTSPQRRALD